MMDLTLLLHRVHGVIIIEAMSILFWLLALIVLLSTKAVAQRYQVDEQLSWAVGVVWFVVLAGIAFAHSRLDMLRIRMEGLEKEVRTLRSKRDPSRDPS